MNPMNLPPPHPPYNSAFPPWAPPPPPSLPPLPPPTATFWSASNVRSRLKELHDTLNLAKAMQKELEMLTRMKEKGVVEDEDKGQGGMSIDSFSRVMKDNLVDIGFQETLSMNAANAIMLKLRFQLEPFRIVTDEKTVWEEKSAVERLGDKLKKNKRNKLWQRRKRRRIAQKLAQEREKFDVVDKEADEWRAREIAKDIAQLKVEKMKEIAKLKAIEEKKKLESELELVLIVEKLQELRSIRIDKLKKQGHFFPEEDDKFLERVRAAVEEEERQEVAAADTDAAKDAIATAEESRNQIHRHAHESEVDHKNRDKDAQDKIENSESAKKTIDTELTAKESAKEDPGALGSSSSSVYDSVANLPLEFYHYYHGSSTDLGTLIEVRRMWDAFIRPGGSRIPAHWVQPPPPSDEIWASYLVRPK